MKSQRGAVQRYTHRLKHKTITLSVPEEMCRLASLFPEAVDAFAAINDTSAANALLAVFARHTLDRSSSRSSDMWH